MLHRQNLSFSKLHELIITNLTGFVTLFIKKTLFVRAGKCYNKAELIPTKKE